jgi:arginyl-tRNA synthetase
MRQQITELIDRSIGTLRDNKEITLPANFSVRIERARDTAHGDLASNVAMLLAKSAGAKPRELAARIIANLPASEYVAKVEIAGPGFINFFLTPRAFLSVVNDIFEAGKNYGRNTHGSGQKILVEFVSTNPTGPLHVGHGRGAAYGAAVANLLDCCGYHVDREYYVNDAGRQMDILALSVWLRYLELCGKTYPFPKNAYQGDYIHAIAAGLHSEFNNKFEAVLEIRINEDPDVADPEAQLDQLIAQAREKLGEQAYDTVFKRALEEIIAEIRDELETMNIRFDNWFSERSLFDSGQVDECIEALEKTGNLYTSNGARWFCSSRYGDEKDRVIVRENGQKTYFASDIAYHLNKFARGYHRMINIWGADHHGYIERVRAALKAMGKDPDQLEILLVQFAVLYRGREKVQMSTRSGNYVTLRDLCREVGNDATRFFYVTRKSEQHLDFDLELAKSRSNDNPVYYIQYAHARICSVLGQMQDRNLAFNQAAAVNQLELLVEPHEQAIVRTLSRYPEVIEAAADKREPHQLGFYLRDLATEFHAYYNSHQFLLEDAALRGARIALIMATRQVIRNGLEILGVSAPENM